MSIYNYENMIIKISSDQDFSSESENDKTKYRHIYKLLHLVNGEQYSTKYSVIIEDQNENISNSAIIIADNAGILQPHEDSAVIKDDKIILVIGSYVVALDLSNLSLLWYLTTENCYGCFSIHLIEKRFIVYCEGSIIGIKMDGTLEWEFTGRDIFVSINGSNPFEITDNWIDLVDFENNKYRIGFDGAIIK